MLAKKHKTTIIKGFKAKLYIQTKRSPKKRMRIFNEALEKAHFRSVVKKLGFWYIDIPRTGSTAIRENLFEEFGWPHGKTRTDRLRHKRMHLPANTPAQTARSEIGLGLWKELFSFAFVRNPYERFASLFFHFLRCEKRFNWDFETFVKELTKLTPITDVANKPFYAYRQVDYVMDRQGVCLLSYVGKYESRADDILHIRNRLNITMWNDEVRAPSIRHNKETHRGMYTSGTRKTVYEYFRSDFEAFGYSPEL